VGPGSHVVIFAAGASRDSTGWTGEVHSWFIGMRKNAALPLTFNAGNPLTPRILPPHPWSPGETRISKPLGEVELTLSATR